MSHSRDLSHTPHLRSAVVCIFSAIVALFASPLRADHPDAEKLLPEKTVVFAKIDNVKDFVAGFSETSFMKMFKRRKRRAGRRKSLRIGRRGLRIRLKRAWGFPSRSFKPF